MASRLKARLPIASVKRGKRHWVSLAALAAFGGFLSCREPTQITLNLTTDALCPAETLAGRFAAEAQLGGLPGADANRRYGRHSEQALHLGA